MNQTKTVFYTATNTFSTLNTYTEKTKNIWMVFHGMGYLSRYFINYFDSLDADENYIIAPQAPSKYYQDSKFKHVGASWLTRENTALEIDNLLNYIDAVYKSEIGAHNCKLFVMGYSQGVSVATRWIARRKIVCDNLILHSGGVPNELKPEDFDHLPPDSKVIYLYGNKDQYLTKARKTEQELLGKKLFKNRLKVEVFDGIHEVNKKALEKYAVL